MPSLIHYQGWDGVSAPNIPTGWTVGAQVSTTASPTGGISPLSNPNVLTCQTIVGTTQEPATYDTADGKNGNVLVYASFSVAALGSTQIWGVFARCSAYPVVIASSTFYWATLSPTANTCELYSVVSGTATPIGSVSIGTALSLGVWYQVQLSCSGPTISVAVVRGSDGYSLNASGNFQSAGTEAISVTDSSVSGSGYAGLTLEDHAATSENIYSDEWYFYSYGGTGGQPGPVRSYPIVQRACSRGQVIQPLAVRFGTPVVPPAGGLRSGIVWRDVSRRLAAVNRGRVWLSTPPQFGVPAPIPFAWWKTIRWVDPSETRRRAAPGKAFDADVLRPAACPAGYPGDQLADDPLGRSVGRAAAARAGAGVVSGRGTRTGRPGQRGLDPAIHHERQPARAVRDRVFLSWTSTGPPGLMFQVYENDVLVWHGRSTYCTLPLPQSVVRFDVGTVGFMQQGVSFASLLPPAPRLQAELTWLGGTFEATDIAGFHIYGENSPGGGIDYTAILATVPAYTAGIVSDGFGYGGFGQGGFGESAGSYSWVSDALTSGTWNFAVVPFDTSGNEGTGATAAVTINAPPPECSPFSDRARLHYAYNNSLQEITLLWNPSPS